MYTTTNRNIVSWRRPAVAAAVCACMASLGAGSAWAGDEDWPLALTLGQYGTRDTNFAKDDSKKSPETILTSVAHLKLNKKYGRQTYLAGLKLSALRYHNHENLNNNAKDANGSFSTELGRNWLVTGSGRYSQSLNDIQNNTQDARLERNIKTYREGGLSVQYGNGATWAIAGTLNNNKVKYSSDVLNKQNANQTSKGLRAIYYASDLVNYSFGTRRVVTKYPLNTSYSEVKDNNIDLSTNWQVTGLSNLSAQITRRSTTYTPSDIAGNTGWTGSAYWNYTPQGITSYYLGFTRATGTDRSNQFAGYVVEKGAITDALTNKINNDTVTTSLEAGAQLKLTGKVALNFSHSITHFKINRTTLNDYQIRSDVSNPDESTGSYNHNTSISVDYAVLRSLTMGCGFTKYIQGADAYRVAYHGQTIDCNANFTID